MKLTKLAICLLAAGTLAFAGCGNKDEEGGGDDTEETAGGEEGGDETAAKGTEEEGGDEGGDEEAKEEGGGGTATEADLDKAWEFFQALAAAAAEAGGDCDAAAEKMGAVMDDHQEILDMMSASKDDQALKDKWDEKYGQKSEDLMKKMMMEDLKDCMQHQGLADVMKRMAG